MAPLDPFDELLPMRERLVMHQVRVHDGAFLVDVPEVAEFVADLDLLLGLDPSVVDVTTRLGVPDSPSVLVSLSNELP